MIHDSTAVKTGIVLEKTPFVADHRCEACGKRFAMVGPCGFFWHDGDNNAWPICRDCAGERGYTSKIVGGIE